MASRLEETSRIRVVNINKVASLQMIDVHVRPSEGWSILCRFLKIIINIDEHPCKHVISIFKQAIPGVLVGL